jgi:soluble lytic murein transglycosylase-like protein
MFIDWAQLRKERNGLSSDMSVARTLMMRHMMLRYSQSLQPRSQTRTPSNSVSGSEQADQLQALTTNGSSVSQPTKTSFSDVLNTANQKYVTNNETAAINSRPIAQRSSKLQQGSTPTTPVVPSQVPQTADKSSAEQPVAPTATWDADNSNIAGLPFADIIAATASKYGVSAALVAAVIKAESDFNPLAQSGAGAKGLMQLMDGTAQSHGVTNSFDPAQNIDGGVKFLSELLQRYNGDVSLALAGYNAGPGAVDQYNGIPPYAETQTYVSRVLGYFNDYQ